ncbi:MAG: ABC transporter transmembrane domain-containing protein [Propylenella sp.]
MDQNIFRYTWRHSKGDQIWLLVVVVASLPFYFLSLDLPKRIVNGPIQGEGFSSPTDTETAIRIAFDLPAWLFGGGEFVIFEGFEFGRVMTLVYLCCLFLFFVLVNGYIKLYISTFKGRVGERMLRRLRYQLVDTLMRFPLPQFRRLRAPEVATMVKDEVEPLGGFIGDAFVTPAFLLSQAITAMVFILLQSVTLGLVAGAIVAVQVVLIPRLRRRLLILGRQRQLTARQLAGRVGEIVEGIVGVRVNDASNWERAEISGRLGRIFFIRFDIYQWKFMVKFINNLLAQVTPFIFYLIGGYFAITGRLDIGQLVAVIAAYKELPSPLKDLIDWDQQRLDVQVKYTQVVEQFTIGKILDPALQKLDPETPAHIEREIAASGLSIRDDSGATLLEPTSIRLTPGEAVAAVGPVGAGGEYLAEALAKLAEADSGRILIDGSPIDTLPDSFTGRRIGYAEASTYFPQASLMDSLIYGLRHAPIRANDEDSRERRRRLLEARASGNTEADIADDWIDYEAAGATGPEDLVVRLREILVLVDLENDVYRLGLRGRMPEGALSQLESRVLAARDAFRERLIRNRGEQYVEMFDPERYVVNASVKENLVFGVADEQPSGNGNREDLYLASVVAETGLEEKLVDMGLKVAETMIDLFGDLAPDNPLLERMDLMAPDEIDEYRAVVRRASSGPASAVEPSDRRALLRLAYGYVEPRHRHGLLDGALQAAIVSARKAFRDNLPEDLSGSIAFYQPGALNRAASIQDNVLFGRIVDTYAEAVERVNVQLRETMDALGLTDTVIELGLNFDIGSGAKRLSHAQQQKLALARALVKRPDLLIVNRALAALDANAQDATVTRVLDFARAPGGPGFTVFWVLSHTGSGQWFDKVLTFENGRIAKSEERTAKAEEDRALEPAK